LKYVDATYGNPGTRKIIVASHERSGTHFMMNTLADNFGYISDPWVDIDGDRLVNPYAPENIRAYLSGSEGRPVLNLFKTHYPAEFFDGIADWLLGEFTIIYMMRDTEPTLRSLRKAPQGSAMERRPCSWTRASRTRSSFTPAHAAGMLRYQMRQYRFLWERHHEHLKGWGMKEPWASQVIHVDYDDLDKDFDATVVRLGRLIGMFPIHEKPKRPGRDDRVIKAETICNDWQPKEETHAA
jgi:hypothetical protein